MTDDLDELSSLARTFFAREVTPNAERFAEQHQVDRETWLKAGGQGCSG
jgi:acyl-CoA dehydrogenase